MDTGEFTPLLVTLSTAIYFFFVRNTPWHPPAFAHVQSLAIPHDVALAMNDK